VHGGELSEQNGGRGCYQRTDYEKTHTAVCVFS